MSMPEIIEVEVQNVYGGEKYYPMNEQAKKLCKALKGQKTITAENVKHFKAMGFTFRQVVIAGGKTVTVGDL